ncbi:SUPPRESSOR OF ABI3-5-like [Papaver somniferum]|uniref:SUPPRESSOR OF ABI3-5-like n=1 Tax=Papaver somniferum TaxID=3469 RepID=UPI000E6FD6D0|nr:SUPPRESSOR OF ABI3-5-like [Papaver somniferum]
MLTGGGTYKRKRFTEEEFPREATSPSYASYLETLMRDSAPPPAVGTCPQPRRKGFDEEPALARDSSQHDKPYVDKLQDSYHGTDSCYDHGYDGTERLSGCNRADFPPDDSDYDRGGKRDDSWKRCDSRERDKKSLSRERDQSDYDRGDKRDDSWKRRDSRERDKKSLSRERDQPDYDRGGKRDDSWKRSRERDQSDYDRGGKRDDSWKRSRERDQSDYDRGGKRDDSWKRHDSRKRDKKSLSRERYRSDYDRGGKKDDSWKRSDSRERDKKSLSRERYQSDYDRGGKRDDSWKRRDSRQRDKKSLSRERDQSPRRRCRHSCSRGNDDRQRSKSPRGYSHHRSYLEDSYDVGRHSSTGKLMNRDDGRIQDHSKVVPSVTVVVKGLPEKTTKEDLYRILVTARKMVDGIGDAGLVVDGRSLLFQFSHRKMCLQQTAVVADVVQKKK